MFIELGQINFRLLILLLYPIGILPPRIITNYYPSNPYFYLFIFFISHYMVLLIKLIYRIKEKLSKMKYEEKIKITKAKNSFLFRIKIENDKKN